MNAGYAALRQVGQYCARRDLGRTRARPIEGGGVPRHVIGYRPVFSGQKWLNLTPRGMASGKTVNENDRLATRSCFQRIKRHNQLPDSRTCAVPP